MKLLKILTPTGESDINKNVSGAIEYDIEKSWISGLRKNGYDDVADYIEKNDLNSNKKRRMDYIKCIIKKKYPNLMNDMERYWINELNSFIRVNKVTEESYISHFYDSITLVPSFKVKSLKIGDINYKIKEKV